MKVTLGYFKDSDKEWVSLLIDNISVAQKGVKDIIGNQLIHMNLSPHPLHVIDEEIGKIIGMDTGKLAFRDICEKMYDKKTVIMNMEGGYIDKDMVDWELVKTKSFNVDGKSNLHNLLKQENGIIETFTEIIED